MSKRLPHANTEIDVTLKRGREAFTRHFNDFMAEATSTQLINWTEKVCGKRYIHSSFIQNLKAGLIKDPNHAALMALGAVNEAAHEQETPFHPIYASSGNCITAETMHQAFCGLIELHENENLDA